MLIYIKQGMTAWVHVFTVSQSALTPTACYAASANPRTETTRTMYRATKWDRLWAILGGQGKNGGKLTLFLLCYFPLWLLLTRII